MFNGNLVRTIEFWQNFKVDVYKSANMNCATFDGLKEVVEYSINLAQIICTLIQWPPTADSQYFKADVGTVFEIATFPLTEILRSRSIINMFFSFKKKCFGKNSKNGHFPAFHYNLLPNWPINIILVSTNMFSDIGNRMGAISKPPDNRVARLRVAGLPNLRISP